MALTRANAAATAALRGSASSLSLAVFSLDASSAFCCANLAACFALTSSLRFLRAAIAAALSGSSPALTEIILPIFCFAFTRESAD